MFAISITPVFLLAEWAKVSTPQTGLLNIADFHRIHWADFAIFALGFPTIAVLSIRRTWVRKIHKQTNDVDL